MRPIDDVCAMSAFAPIATKLLNYSNGRIGPRRNIAMLTPVHSLVQESISLFFAKGTIFIEVSFRRDSIFDEVYTDFVSSAPQHFGAMNPSFARDVQFNGVDYWRSREKFNPGAGIRNIVYDAFNRTTRFTKIRKPMQIAFHDRATRWANCGLMRQKWRRGLLCRSLAAWRTLRRALVG
jgi:hypothetical protein